MKLAPVRTWFTWDNTVPVLVGLVGIDIAANMMASTKQSEDRIAGLHADIAYLRALENQSLTHDQLHEALQKMGERNAYAGVADDIRAKMQRIGWTDIIRGPEMLESSSDTQSSSWEQVLESVKQAVNASSENTHGEYKEPSLLRRILSVSGSDQRSHADRGNVVLSSHNTSSSDAI